MTTVIFTELVEHARHCHTFTYLLLTIALFYRGEN